VDFGSQVFLIFRFVSEVKTKIIFRIAAAGELLKNAALFNFYKWCCA
jgi:hypothetical protein